MGRGMMAGKKPKQRTGGGNMQQQLKQLQAMQAEMEKAQEDIKEKEITTTAGGGAVEVTINGAKEITKLVIDKNLVASLHESLVLCLLIIRIDGVLFVEIVVVIDKINRSESAVFLHFTNDTTHAITVIRVIFRMHYDAVISDCHKSAAVF